MGVLNALKTVILGAPGSGKGTISARIVRDFGLKHVSSGDLLRAQIIKQSEIGNKAKQYIDKGKLVPDDIITKLIAEELSTLGCQNWLLDGFPRTHGQAEALQRLEPLKLAINLDVPAEVIVDRIKGRWTHLASGRIYHTKFNPPKTPGVDDITGEPLIQRDDDKPEVVLNRLATYRKNVDPLLDYYRKLGILEEFHGQESNEIWPRVHSFLSRLLPAKSGPF